MAVTYFSPETGFGTVTEHETLGQFHDRVKATAARPDDVALINKAVFGPFTGEPAAVSRRDVAQIQKAAYGPFSSPANHAREIISSDEMAVLVELSQAVDRTLAFGARQRLNELIARGVKVVSPGSPYRAPVQPTRPDYADPNPAWVAKLNAIEGDLQGIWEHQAKLGKILTRGLLSSGKKVSRGKKSSKSRRSAGKAVTTRGVVYG